MFETTAAEARAKRIRYALAQLEAYTDPTRYRHFHLRRGFKEYYLRIDPGTVRDLLDHIERLDQDNAEMADRLSRSVERPF